MVKNEMRSVLKGFITKNWDPYLESFDVEDRDIYFTERYVKLYEGTGASAEAFVFEDAQRVYLFPYIRKEMSISGGPYFDFETPYGYGGPLSNCNDRSFIEAAFREFCELAVENNIVAGFIRFHPLLKNQSLVSKGCEVLFDRKTVAIDLRDSDEEIWKIQVHKNHRTSIRKAEKSGLRFVVDDELKHLDRFIGIYNDMLNNLNGEDFYRFSNDYYEGIRESLGKDSFLGLVYFNDKIISAIIFFLYGVYGHAHLGGSLAEYFNYCPNNFLFFKAALYLKGKGVKFFHFGGGTDGSEDNLLYKFKKRFSKNEFDFFIGKMVLNEGVYQRACLEWESMFPEKKELFKKFLLKYRY